MLLPNPHHQYPHPHDARARPSPPCAEIRDTLNNLILKSPQSWQTSVGLPFFQITGTVRAPSSHRLPAAASRSRVTRPRWQVVEWDEVRFDVRLMQRVPYEGTSRMTTSLRRRQRDRVVRRGLAMMIEVRRSPITIATPFDQSLTRVHVCLAERLLRHRRRPRPLCRSAQVHPLLRPGGGHRIGCRPTHPAHASNPYLTTTSARAQTCNFDVLYAVRGRVSNPSPLARSMPTLTCRLPCSCAVPDLWQLRLQRELAHSNPIFPFCDPCPC